MYTRRKSNKASTRSQLTPSCGLFALHHETSVGLRFSGTDNIQSGGLVGERRASDGDHYSIPYRETTTITRRRIGRGGGNYKYDDIGPVDASGVPLGTREV